MIVKQLVLVGIVFTYWTGKAGWGEFEYNDQQRVVMGYQGGGKNIKPFSSQSLNNKGRCEGGSLIDNRPYTCIL